MDRSMIDNTLGQDASQGNISNDLSIPRLSLTRGMLKSQSDSYLRGRKSGQAIQKAAFQRSVASYSTRSDAVMRRHSRLGVAGGSIVKSPKSHTNDPPMLPAIVQSPAGDPQMMPTVAREAREEPQSPKSHINDPPMMPAIVHNSISDPQMMPAVAREAPEEPQSPKSHINDPPIMLAIVQNSTGDPQSMPAVAREGCEEPQEPQPMLEAKARVFSGIRKCRRAEGMYVSIGESLTGRRVYLHEQEKLMVYYWDGRDGEEFAGWWCGDGIAYDSHDVGFCESSAQAQEPPVSGWSFPVNFGIQPTIRFDICEPPMESSLQTYAQRQQEVAEDERQRKLADESRRQREAAEKAEREKKAREERQEKLEKARAVELKISGWLRGLKLGIPPWLHGGLGIHLFLSGTLKWEKEKKARLDFFGTEWKVPDGWVFGYGSGLQALEATSGAASDFPATVQFKWGNCVKTPEHTSLYQGGVTTEIALFLASFFAKHDGHVLISGHSQGVVYALLLFRTLQEAAEGKYSIEQEIMEGAVPEAVFGKKLMEIAKGRNSQEKLQKWARNARALVTGPCANAFNREWAEYYLLKHQSQIAFVVSSVAMSVDSPDGSGPWERYFECVFSSQKKVAKLLGRIPDLMYGFTEEGRCLADAQVKTIFEENAFLLEARLCTDIEGFQRADDQGRVLHRGLNFLQMVGPSFKWSFEPQYDSLRKAGATWELHKLETYRRIAKLLPETLGGS
mmetsp:Transcript_62724/g.119076  ORF Transcript_62724/g.119076 Transcript_62724/m.119076 type:complete len:734 (+) Transcript_62724:150-2351(+)